MAESKFLNNENKIKKKEEISSRARIANLKLGDTQTKKSKIRNIGFLISLFLLSTLLPVGIKFYKAYNFKKSIYFQKVEQEKRLRQEVRQLEVKTKNMKEEKQFLQTDEGIEKVARDKLGLTKPSEIPLVVDQKNDGTKVNILK